MVLILQSIDHSTTNRYTLTIKNITVLTTKLYATDIDVSLTRRVVIQAVFTMAEFLGALLSNI